jgi:hypothetical protein
MSKFLIPFAPILNGHLFSIKFELNINLKIQFKLHAMSLNIFIKMKINSQKINSILFFNQLIVIGSVQQCKAQVFLK